MPAFILIRILLGEPAVDPFHLGLGPGDGGARRQPKVSAQEMDASEFRRQRIDYAQRRPQIDGRLRHPEACRHYTDDGVAVAAERNRLPDYRRIAGKVLLPERIAQ